MFAAPFGDPCRISRIDVRAVPGSVLRIREEVTMDRSQAARAGELSLDELEGARDLRAAISTALAATPINDESLRRGVWTYVRGEHDLGTPPGAVIDVLTQLVVSSSIHGASAQQRTMRQIILWSVEAYFGYLGGEVVGGGTEATSVVRRRLRQ